MKVFIFNREKYIKERLDFHKESSEKVSKLTNEEKERMIKITTWIDYDSIEKMSNEHGWEVMGFNRDMTKIYIIESPMGKELDLYIKAIEPKYVMIKDIEKKYWD